MSAFTDVKFSIPKKSDRQLLQELKKAFLDSSMQATTQVVIVPMTGGAQFASPIDSAEKDAAIQEYLNLDKMLFRTISVPLYDGRTQLRINRQDGSATDNCVLELSSLQNHPNNRPNQQPPNPFELSRLAANLKACLGEITPLEAKHLLGQQLAGHYERRENEMAQLQATLIEVSKRFTEGAAEHAQKLREELRSDRQRLHDEFENKRQREAQLLGEREASLQAREEELSQKLTDLDDRAARHARRRIREDLKEELTKRSAEFNLTKGTQAMRTPIVVACALVWLGALLILALLVQKAGDNVELLSEPVFVLRQVAAGLTIAATAVFYFRWQNRWFEQHAQEEFRLKRMALDIDRASWVVEMAMEWKDEKGTEIPPNLLERLTARLFEDESKQAPNLHPAEQLASALLGASSRVKLPLPGGGELELGSKGIKSLEQSTIKGT